VEAEVRFHLEEVDADERIMLSWISEKQVAKLLYSLTCVGWQPWQFLLLSGGYSFRTPVRDFIL